MQVMPQIQLKFLVEGKTLGFLLAALCLSWTCGVQVLMQQE